MKVDSNSPILLVDDMTYTLEMMEEHLKAIGFRGPIFKASNLAEAIKTIKDNYTTPNRVVLIISDLNIGNESGIDLVKKVRITPQIKDTPFLLVTSENNIDVILKAVEAGISSYMEKPWTLDELKKKIAECIKKSRPPSA